VATLKKCSIFHCYNKTTKTYCKEHNAFNEQSNRRRGSSYERGYTVKWRVARLDYLSKNPLCVTCAKRGITTFATVVDHIVPHKGDYKLFWDRSNWQSMCKVCHDSKTAKETEGFGKQKPDIGLINANRGPSRGDTGT